MLVTVQVFPLSSLWRERVGLRVAGCGRRCLYPPHLNPLSPLAGGEEGNSYECSTWNTSVQFQMEDEQWIPSVFVSRDGNAVDQVTPLACKIILRTKINNVRSTWKLFH